MHRIAAGLLPMLDRLGYVFTPYAWFAHVLLGLPIQALAAVPLRRLGVRSGWWIGAALSAGFWWGRKKMEFEYALERRAGLHTDAPFWWRGWLPIEWSWTRQLEFYAPVLAALTLALLMERRGRQPHRRRR